MSVPVIHRIPYNETKQWILEKHYAKRMPCVQYAFGFFDPSLIGIVTYGQPASPPLCRGICGDKYRLRVIELNRLVICDGNKNVASRLISGSLKQLPNGLIVVSYADTKMGHIGYVYQSCNWIYTGITKARTDMKSVSGHSRHNSGDSKDRQSRSAKHRYITFTGTKRDKKKLTNALKYSRLPYPKGESMKYDASAIPVVQEIMFSNFAQKESPDA